MARQVKACEHCGTVQIVESAYDKMTELEKAQVVAQQTAIDFLEAIAEGYDQDSAPLRGTCAEKLQSPDAREKIPVISDANIATLQQLLLNFFQRNINLEFAEEPKETTNGTSHN